MLDSEPQSDRVSTNRVAPEEKVNQDEPNSKLLEKRKVKIDDYILYTMNRNLLEIKASPFKDQIQHAGKVNEVQFSRCGHYLASGSSDRHLKVWNILENKQIFLTSFSSSVNAVSFSHDSKLLAVGTDKHTLNVFDFKAKLVFYEKEVSGKVLSVCFSPINYSLALGTSEGELIIINIGMKHQDANVITISKAYSNANQYPSLQSEYDKEGKEDDEMLLNQEFRESPVTNRKYAVANDQKDTQKIKIYSVRFSNKGNLIAYGSSDKTLRVWDIEKGREVFNRDLRGKVLSVAFTHDDLKVAASSKNFSELSVCDISQESNSPNYIKFNVNIENSYIIYSICFSQNGDHLVVGNSRGEIILWNIKESKIIFSEKHAKEVSTVCFSADGHFLASGSYDTTVKIWNINYKQKEKEFYGFHLDTVRTVSFSPNCRFLATGSDDCNVRVWNIESKCEISKGEHKGPVYCVQFSSDGKYIASGSYDNTAKIWKFKLQEKGDNMNILDAIMIIKHDNTVYSVCISSKVNYFTSGSYDGVVKIVKLMLSEKNNPSETSYKSLLNIQEKKNKHIDHKKIKEFIYNHEGPVFCVIFSDDEKYQASGSYDSKVYIHNIEKNIKQFLIIQTNFKVSKIAFSQNSKFLASGSYDKNYTKVWSFDELVSQKNKVKATNKPLELSKRKESSESEKDNSENEREESKIEKGNKKKIIQEPLFRIKHSDSVSSLAFSNKRYLIASGSNDGSLKVWNIKLKQELFIGNHKGAVTSLAFTQRGDYLASGGYDDCVRVWNTEEKQEEYVFSHSDTVTSVSFSSDDCLLASGSFDKTLKVWNISQANISTNIEYNSTVNSVLFSPKSKLIASRCENEHIILLRIKDIQNDENKNPLNVQEIKETSKLSAPGIITSFAFSCDGLLLASGSMGKFNLELEQNNQNEEECKVVVWNIKNGIEILQGVHGNTINSLSFSPDSSFLASASFDHKIKIWNLSFRYSEPQKVHIPLILEYKGKVTIVAFTPDGRYLASGSYDQKVKIWDTTGIYYFFRKQNIEPIQKDLISIEQESSEDIRNSRKVNKKSKELKLVVRGNHSGPVTSLSCSKTSNLIASGSYDNTIKVWDIKEMNEKFTGNHSDTVNSVIFSPDCNFIASGSDDKMVKVWNINAKREEFIGLHSGRVITVDFSPDGCYLASGSTDNTVKVWNIKEKREEFMFEHKDTINSVQFSPNGYYLASGSDDKQLRFCKIMKEPIKFIRRRVSTNIMKLLNPLINTININQLRLSSNLRFAAFTVPQANMFAVAELYNPIKPFLVFGNFTSVSFSYDGKFIAFGLESQELKILNLETKDQNIIRALDSPVHATCFTHDSLKVAVAFGNTVKEFSIESNQDETRPENNFFLKESGEVFITIICYSSDDNLLACGFSNGDIQILKKSNDSQTIESIKNIITSICFSVDGKYFAVGSDKGIVKAFNFNTNKLIFSYQKDFDLSEASQVSSVSISYNEVMIVAGFLDNGLVIWNLETNSIILKYKFIDSVLCTLFSDFQKFLVVALRNGEIKYYEIDKISAFLYYNEVKNHQFKVKGKQEIIIDSDPLYYFYECKCFDVPRIFETQKDYEDLQIKESKFGFELMMNTNEIVKNIRILDYKGSELTFEVGSKRFNRNLNQIPKINEMLKDLLEYQLSENCVVDIHTEVVPLNTLMIRPNSIPDSFQNNEIHHKCTLDIIRQSNYIKCLPDYCNILISQYKYTLLHFASFLGQTKALVEILERGQDIIYIKADAFGKSPLFYSILRNHQTSTDAILDYLINIDCVNISKLITCLHSTRNDFLMIIKNSSVKLQDYLSILYQETQEFSKVPATNNLPLVKHSETIQPGTEDFEVPLSDEGQYKSVTGVIKFTCLPLPLEPYSNQAAKALMIILNCSNKKIYDTFVIQYFINANWKIVYNHALCYSFLIWIHMILYSITLINQTNIWALIPFWVTYCLIFLNEFFQMLSNFDFYLNNSWNIVDTLIILWTPVWSVFRIINIDLIYADLILGFLLMIRGCTAFKVFDRTRDYIDLIIQAIKNMVSFLIIFIYSSFCFSLFLYVIYSNDESYVTKYHEILRMSWGISYGGDDMEKSENKIIFFVNFVSTVLNMILMLNMLISILSDSYAQFSIERNSIDYREKIYLILEIYNSYFWGKPTDKSYYLHVLSDQIKKEPDEDWQGNLMYTEQCQNQRIENLASEIAEIAKSQKLIYLKHDETQRKIEKMNSYLIHKLGK